MIKNIFWMYNLKRYIIMGLSLTVMMLYSCSKSTSLSPAPYYSPLTLPVQFLGKPVPASANIGDEVTFQVTGLKKLKSFTFYLSQIQAQVVSYTDSLITVVVPPDVSSGRCEVLTSDGQYFYGPVLSIISNVSIDNSFNNSKSGTNGPINYVSYSVSNGGYYLLCGNFSDYDNMNSQNPINGIAGIDQYGNYQSDKSNSGAEGGTIASLLNVNGQYIIGGALGNYGGHNIAGVTRLNSDLSLDTTIVNLVNPDTSKHQNNTDTVPALNTYISGYVQNLFRDDTETIAVGNFAQYFSYYYPRSQKGTYYIDNTNMAYFIRFRNNGTLDSSYNFNLATGRSNNNLNGSLIGSIQLASGKIIVVGSFTKFNGAPAPRIAALADDGSQDAAFALGVGTGADGEIDKITYNAITHKILIVGSFTSYNGHPAKGIAMLNEDGSLDTSFTIGNVLGGRITYAGQLSNGKIIVAGNFDKYNNIFRQGFMILNSDASLAAGYNNTGVFNGDINGIVEITSNTVLLYGNFSIFDNVAVGNLVRIILK